MRTIHRYTVHPAIPARLGCLSELAYNLRWTWDYPTVDLFRRLDDDLWEQSEHNPVLMLGRISQERLIWAAEDEAFLAQLDRVWASFQAYMSEPGWFHKRYPEAAGLRIAYFCMEFGLAECLPIYSGGLGVLAGDHLKAASGYGLPLVGVGLLYQKGYFRQYLNSDGWQLERFPVNDFSTMPVRPSRHDDGSPVTVTLELAGRNVSVQVWTVQVGRIPLYLLDTNVPTNHPEDQVITAELYGGGPEDRIRQEIVLGIGGIRALKAVGITPEVCHLNEGHTTFLSLERIRLIMREAGLDFHTARQVTGAGTLFTTHTPVPAGFDLFSRELMEKYFAAYVQELGMSLDSFLGEGRIHPEDTTEPFNVAALAVRHSPRRNAVSQLHRRVTARMMKLGWKDFPERDIPIEAVTNGVYLRGWVGGEMAQLFDRYLGPRWQEDPADPAVWERVYRIPDEELWRAHVRQREALVSYTRQQLVSQAERRQASKRERDVAAEALSAGALTIGFARRFATYKRATLILREVDRIKSILLDERRPVQIIFGGKAHPRDDGGKQLIREIVHFAQQEGLQHRLVFLEDYDLARARMLVQGADVWLNTPRRPMEASGTSGMKVVSNGGLNVSVLDGWWAEGYRPEVGWAIGTGEEFVDFEYQDRVEALALYSILEQEVIPLFYDRGADGLPREWITMMKASMRYLGPTFSAARMVREYTEHFYLPAANHFQTMSADGYHAAKESAAWKARVRNAWQEVAVLSTDVDDRADVAVGEALPIEARVRLGQLDPRDVKVEVYSGLIAPDGDIADGEGTPLEWTGEEDGAHIYRGAIPSRMSGIHGYAVRVLPSREGVLIPAELSLIAWE